VISKKITAPETRSPAPEDTAMTATDARYIKPKSATNAFNVTVARLTRMGVSVYGSRILSVRGRTSGEWRSNPVNPLTLADGTRYLVAPRGNTQWVRNLRAAGTGELRVGRRAEPFTATEVADDDKPAILRAYLKRWKFEVGVFFDGVDAKAPEQKLREIAPGYPIFRIETAR
jgi:deazaflavin-dependent oxidoreductase (nitroreductase family)